MKRLCILLVMATVPVASQAKVQDVPNSAAQPHIVPVAKGWAKNSVNATIFRVNALTTHGNTQYIAFYDQDSHVVLAKRKLASIDWQIHKTKYKGNTKDAHNGICIGLDGSGTLHMSWDHHCDPLNYCRAVAPGSLELTERLPMTGQNEQKVTYPEFHNLPNGDLLFLYRDGSSGNGNTMLNRYHVKSGKWSAVQHPLINGQGQCNAYTNQIAVDKLGHWHISWCWRQTPDVATNHDICYAKSADQGRTWQKSAGEKYSLPITAETAEYACRIPQKSELINQTSMTVDSKGRPLITTYWRPKGTDVPQYHLVYHDGRKWQTRQVGRRKEAFSLSGGGTKRLRMSRPIILADSTDNLYMVFRDAERGGQVSVAVCEDSDRVDWRIEDLTNDSVGQWEPSCDPVLWRRQNVLHLFLQQVEQRDRDALEDTPAQMVSVLQWRPN
ncbi:MAG: BNR repeat-containing protein [Planctomycetota bacterium]